MPTEVKVIKFRNTRVNKEVSKVQKVRRVEYSRKRSQISWDFLLILLSRSIDMVRVIKNESVHVTTRNIGIIRNYIRSANVCAPSQNFWWESPRIMLSHWPWYMSQRSAWKYDIINANVLFISTMNVLLSQSSLTSVFLVLLLHES